MQQPGVRQIVSLQGNRLCFVGFQDSAVELDGSGEDTMEAADTPSRCSFPLIHFDGSELRADAVVEGSKAPKPLALA